LAGPPNRQRRAGRALRAATATIALLALGGASAATGAGGGTGSGSVSAPGTPKIRDSICLTDCLGLDKAVAGSTVQVSGRKMAAVDAVSFRSSSSKTRVLAPITAVTATSAQAVVPEGVRSGKLQVHDIYGQRSDPDPEPLLIRPKANLRAAGPLHVVDAKVAPNKVLFGSRSATLKYVVRSGQPTNDVRVDVVTPAGEVVQSFFPTGVAPNATQTVAWNGAGFDGKPVADGWYAFRLSSPDGQQLARARSSDSSGLGVAVFSYMFPVRGRHDFGSSGARFGASRSGHTHQGQDVMAACGTKLVAARGGKVQYNGYQGSAGNYLVIDQQGSGEDNAYMHLQTPSPLPVGSMVGTGQYIGNVGDTGNAQGCHLHFEVWSPPGWYQGGQPYDPLPLLLAWDKYS
jgi:murein DD-endopeptidase MepM/ murein hydrolase activator NlpD